MLVCLEHTSHCTVATPWVLTAELVPAGASDTLLELLMTRQCGARLGLAEPPPDFIFLEALTASSGAWSGLCVFPGGRYKDSVRA